MEGVRSLLSDQLQEAPQPSPLPQEPPPAIQERAKTPEPPTSHINSTTEALQPPAIPIPEEGKSLLLQGLEGTMALLAAKGVEGTKSIYPLAMENLRAFLPYNNEGVKSYLQERIESHKAGRERRESGRPCEDAGEVRQGHRSHHSPKSQLSNPRHDATLVHAIRELHEEEFGLDAVLLAEGGHVGAHCAVLAAASPFLKTLLLTTPDHPAIISVTGTPLAMVQGVVTCLYTGTVPPGASLYQLIEVANLLRMDDLSLVLQQTFLAQGGSLLELSRLQGTRSSAPPYHTHSESHHTHTDLYHDRSEKKRGSRLDQILYQKLNVNHLAPTSTPDHCPAPPLDPRGGILGELLTKADPLRSAFAAGGYSFPDLTLDPQANPTLKPLNLSKDSKSDPSSSYSHYAAASQSDLTLGALASLPCNMPGLLAPLTHNSMLPSALASLTTTSALASLGVHHSLAAAKSKSSSKSRSCNRSSRSSSRHSSNSRKSSHPSLPLLHSLKSNMVTQDAAKELSDHLKLNPHLASLTGNFDSLHNNLSALSSSASLQSLANLHNLSNLHNFPALFPFLAPVTSENIGKDTHLLHGNPAMDLNLPRVSSEQTRSFSPSATTSEDQGALNLSAAAPQCDSPKPFGNDDRPNRTVDSAEGRSGEGGDEGGEETGSAHHTSPKEDGCQGLSMCSFQPAKSESDSLSSRLGHSTANSFLGHSLDSRTLPLLLMSSGANLTGTTQNPGDVPKTVDASVETIPMTKQEPPPLVSLDDGDPQDDNGIEVIEEIPGNRCPFHVRKTLYHAGHVSNSHPTFPHLQMGRKRKGCGECDGCQVVEDCSQCRFCRDKAKFGGPNRLKQVCVYKRCVLAEIEPEEAKKRRKMSGKKSRGKCGGCDGCQRTLDCNECYACLHNAAAQPPARRKICEMRVCEQQQMEEVRAALSVAGEPSPYSTDSLLLAETLSISSGASSPTPDQPSTHNDKMKLMRKMLKKKFAQPYSRVSPSKVRTKYYCGECPGCQTTTPCGNCLYCEDMPKFGGPGRYRQKCVKQLCVYHPRLQALKLSNRSKLTYDEQHISQETLSHLGTSLPSVVAADALDLGCRDNLEELESLGDDVDDVTEGEDSNAPLHVETALEELRAIKTEPTIKLETVLSPSSIIPSHMIPSTIIPSSAIPSPIIPCALPPPMLTLPPVSADSIPTPSPYLPSNPPTDPEPEVIPICDDSNSSIPNIEDSTMSTADSESATTMTTTTTTSAIPSTTTTTAATTTTTTTDDADPVTATTTTTTAALTLSPTPTSSQSPPAPALTPTPPSEAIAPSSPTPCLLPVPALKPTSCLLPVPALTPTPCLSPVPALTPTTQPPVPTHIPTSSQSPPPVHMPTPSQSPTLAHTPTPSQSPVPAHIPTSSQSPTPVHIPTPSQSPTPAHMPIPSQSLSPAHMPVPSQSPTPAQMPMPSQSPTPAQMPIPSQSPPPVQISTPSLSPTPAHISTLSLSPTTALVPTTTPSQSPPPATAPNPKAIISETGTENLEELNDIEPDDEDDDEEDYDDREDYAALMSDASDIPSPPSTPSPRPKTRGRGSFRGRGRGRGGKEDLDDIIIETRRKKAMRRGSRRRKTRFNLEPDDNSDFEELLEELDANGLPKVVGEASGQSGEATGGVPLPGNQAERLSVNLKEGQATPVVDGRGGRGGGRGQRYMNPPAKMVSRSQNTDPDIFEFQDSQDLKREVIEMRRSGLGLRREGLENRREGVETRRVRMEGVETRRGVEARREALEMRKEGLETRREGVETRREPQEGGVSLKRNGPYAGFPEEELSQGGRDVNENVGGISEAASA